MYVYMHIYILNIILLECLKNINYFNKYLEFCYIILQLWKEARAGLVILFVFKSKFLFWHRFEILGVVGVGCLLQFFKSTKNSSSRKGVLRNGEI